MHFEEVVTFAEAKDIIGKGDTLLTDMVKSGRLIEGIHFRAAGRIKIMDKELALSIKNGDFDSMRLKLMYKFGKELGNAIKNEGNIGFTKSWILTKHFNAEKQYKQIISDLMKLAKKHEIEFPKELIESEDMEMLTAYVCGLTCMFR